MAPARDNAARKQGLEATDLQPDAKIKHSAWESLGKCGVGADAHQQGVQPTLAHNLELRGFRTPSPIQRASIPPALSKPGRDVLGMARTGSGKTLAYLIPVLQRLGRERRVFHGARALILCPNRELALQILKAGKDIARGARLSGIEDKCLKWVLLIGGDPMERQFAELSSSPDIIIATPGRFLHLMVEMSLDLRRLEMVVFDEADRLFEMGFDPQLHEILHRLPSDRQSLLFSATLPSSVAEFAKAGLNNPILIRLDTEHKVSPDLSLSFLSVKPHEKDAGLLVLLDRILEIRSDPRGEGESTQAIIFVSTKHHVEYVTTLLATAGYRVAHVYGSLDQVARQRQLETFRAGEKAVLVVTDVAARGLDIPVLENVVNFDFPSSSRVFVHRVGRTARAGRKGAAWSLVTRDDMPYFLDLEIFLGPIIGAESCPCAHMPQNLVDDKVEYILHSLDEASPQLALLRQVMLKGQAMFDRSRSKASRQAYRAAKANDKCIGPGGHFSSTHPAFALAKTGEALGDQARLIASVDRYRPNETVLEIRARGQNTSSHLMQARRRLLDRRLKPPDQRLEGEHDQHTVVLTPIQHKSFKDPHFFLTHSRDGAAEEKAYSFREDDPFALQVRAATFDLSTDEGTSQRPQKANQLKWDRKKKRFIAGNAIGADNKKMIRSESGAQLPASFRSGRYEKWLKARRNVTIDGSEDQHAASSLVKATFRGARRSPRGQAPRFDPDTSGLQQRRRLSKTGVSSTGGRKTTSPRQRELKSAEGVLRNRQNVERTSYMDIDRRLAAIASCRTVSISQREKRNLVLIDVDRRVMILAYIPQPHRFDILEGYGCQNVVWKSLPAVFLVYLWPVVISMISLIYGGIAIRFFLTRRLQLQSLLKASQSGLDSNQYLRLMALSGSDFLLSFPLTVYFLIENSIDYLPFNWDDVHYGFSYVGIYTEEEFGYYWAGDRLYTSVLLAKYILPLLAFLFFLFFGVAEDAVAEYFRWYHGVRRMLRLKPSQHDQQASFAPTLGSTVVKSAGADWIGSKDDSGDDEYDEALNYSSTTTAANGPSVHGTPIAVLVEREVV